MVLIQHRHSGLSTQILFLKIFKWYNSCWNWKDTITKSSIERTKKGWCVIFLFQYAWIILPSLCPNILVHFHDSRYLIKSFIFFNLYYFSWFWKLYIQELIEIFDWCKQSQKIIHKNIWFFDSIKRHECQKKTNKSEQREQ